MTTCERVAEDLAALAEGDRDAIARHAEHLASCDACRDARHEASELAEMLASAGADHRAPAEAAVVGTLMARLEGASVLELRASGEPEKTSTSTSTSTSTIPSSASASPSASASASASASSSPEARGPRPEAPRRWLFAVGATALAAGATGLYLLRGHAPAGTTAPDGSIGQVASVVRAAADHADGVFVRTPASPTWQPLREHGALPAGAELRTDERTRASLSLADGTQLVLDHLTTISFDTAEPRHVRVGVGRLLADVAHVDNRPAEIDTPSGAIDVVGTRFVVTATDVLTSVQVVRGQIVLRGGNAREDVRAGEEGTIDHGAVSVSPVPSLAHEVEWAELTASAKPDEITSGLGSLRAYKPGESRDRDWNLALAKHDVKVRIVGPIARTEITETFRNDSPAELEGVYQFPLPVDAQIDSLALDQKDGFVDGAFVDKERGAKIWKGVIDKATPHPQQLATNEIIWVDGSWRDPALLDWKRGGRFELRVFPIPPKGQRTIKLAYTQVVAPRGEWRQYVYPLPHSKDGSTVADQLDVDVEVRGGVPGAVRTLGYKLEPDPQRKDLDALTMHQAGFVPRGVLVIA